METDVTILHELQCCEERPSPEANTVPLWLDRHRFEEGKLFFQKHPFLCGLCMFLSLVVGLSVNSLLEAMVFTKQSDTPKKAFKRYMSTIAHVTRWHFGDVWNFDESVANQSILSVRRMHDKVRKEMDEQKKDRSHITQYDMAWTQFGFMGMIVTHCRKIGIKCTDYELECYTHFWAGIGHLLGINDQFNVCLRGYESAVQFTKEMEVHIIIPALQNPPGKFYPMAKVLTDGFSTIFSPMTVESLVLLFLDIVGYSNRDHLIPMLKSTTLLDRMVLAFYKLLLMLVRFCPFVENVLNRIIRMLVLKMNGDRRL